MECEETKAERLNFFSICHTEAHFTQQILSSQFSFSFQFHYWQTTEKSKRTDKHRLYQKKLTTEDNNKMMRKKTHTYIRTIHDINRKGVVRRQLLSHPIFILNEFKNKIVSRDRPNMQSINLCSNMPRKKNTERQ